MLAAHEGGACTFRLRDVSTRLATFDHVNRGAKEGPRRSDGQTRGYEQAALLAAGPAWLWPGNLKKSGEAGCRRPRYVNRQTGATLPPRTSWPPCAFTAPGADGPARVARAEPAHARARTHRHPSQWQSRLLAHSHSTRPLVTPCSAVGKAGGGRRAKSADVLSPCALRLEERRALALPPAKRRRQRRLRGASGRSASPGAQHTCAVRASATPCLPLPCVGTTGTSRAKAGWRRTRAVRSSCGPRHRPRATPKPCATWVGAPWPRPAVTLRHCRASKPTALAAPCRLLAQRGVVAWRGVVA